MRDERLNQLARQLIGYSVDLQPGERVLIEDFGGNTELVKALIEQAYAHGGHPYPVLRDHSVERALYLGYDRAMLAWMTELDAARMASCQAYIGIRGGLNAFETADVSADKKKLYNQLYNDPVHSAIRCAKTKWVVLRYPTPGMAQQAGMSTEQFEKFYFDVCLLDYREMSLAMDPLVKRLEAAKEVHIVGPGTDLRFSIEGLPAIKCDGRLNIPDGEVYTAPVRDSVNGVISYNTPSLYQGLVHENIRFVFKNGRIVEATGSRTGLLNQILDTDEGARYVGEFAIGVHPHVTIPMKDTLFDEKIRGSFHLTPGACYEHCSNGNHSAIHWDLVLIQTEEYGGGEIYLDGELIRKNGVFVPEDLKGLDALK